MAKKLQKRGTGKSGDLTSKIKKDKFALPSGYVAPRDHGHKTSFTSTRKAIYRGQNIRVRTTYRIEIDGEPLTLHTYVLDDGTVHCHGLPNYSFPSALDMARAIIDAVPLAHVEKDELGKAPDNHAGGHDY